jgi:murein DD-endopeptidase MepM/ murein hydrolase activator NlpD
MRTIHFFTSIVCLAVLFLLLPGAIHAQLDTGGGALDIPLPEHPCVSPELEADVLTLLVKSRVELMEKGMLPTHYEQREELIQLEWPLKQASGFDQPSYYTTVNYVDLDPTGGIKDYQCNSRSYNGHNGIDLSLWPFWWMMMEDEQVEIVAAAPGVILAKHDNHFDKNCDCVGTWNAVYIAHSDGSVAWYGHMKKNSLTQKPVGAMVAAGEYLGLVGSSGCSSNPHLHFEIRDMNQNVIDPYAGPCNSTTTTSWWTDQKPYQEPAINRLTTHHAAPVFKGFCPADEIPNLDNQFYPGELIYFTAWYRDQLLNAPTSYLVKDPHDDVIFSWNQQSPASYLFSYWYWSFQLPQNAVEGMWTFQATFHGEEITHMFQVGEVSAIQTQGERKLAVFPNPVISDLYIHDPGNAEMTYRLINLQGGRILEGKLEAATARIDMGTLNASTYLLHILNTSTGESILIPVVKAH